MGFKRLFGLDSQRNRETFLWLRGEDFRTREFWGSAAEATRCHRRVCGSDPLWWDPGFKLLSVFFLFFLAVELKWIPISISLAAEKKTKCASDRYGTFFLLHNFEKDTKEKIYFYIILKKN